MFSPSKLSDALWNRAVSHADGESCSILLFIQFSFVMLFVYVYVLKCVTRIYIRVDTRNILGYA